jgi:hypothetical protein
LPRILLPPGCAGFADGDRKYIAERGPGSFVNIDDTDPVGRRALEKLRGQDYAAAGLVTGEEKFFVRSGPEGRWCPHCPDNTIWHSWTRSCPSCGGETVPEAEMARDLPEGPYKP